MRRLLRDEGGQSVVLIAVSLPVVLSLLLLVIDGGRLYVERERIRNAAQLAAEAAVSLAGDAPGVSQPNAQRVRDIVKQALDRNLPGETFGHSVTAPFRSEMPAYNVKVSVTKPFRASIQGVSFTIAADGAAKLGEASGSTPALTPLPTPTPAPSPTARPTVSPTPTPTRTATPSPAPTPTPRVSITISSAWYSPADLAPYANAAGCPSPSRGCYRPEVRYSIPFGQWSGTSYDTDGRPGIGFMTPPGETHVYGVTIRWRNGTSERVDVRVTWPLDGRPYDATPYAVTVTRP